MSEGNKKAKLIEEEDIHAVSTIISNAKLFLADARLEIEGLLLAPWEDDISDQCSFVAERFSHYASLMRQSAYAIDSIHSYSALRRLAQRRPCNDADASSTTDNKEEEEKEDRA